MYDSFKKNEICSLKIRVFLIALLLTTQLPASSYLMSLLYIVPKKKNYYSYSLWITSIVQYDKIDIIKL